MAEEPRERSMAEEPRVSSRRRNKNVDTSRAEALDRLQALRQGDRRSEVRKYQVRIEEPIYDTLPEDQYASLVAKRGEEARDFIVGDDGHGYVDEGEEEDWTKAGGPPSSDESDEETEKAKKKKKVKKVAPPKKPNPLAAAGALMGKQRLSSMFTSSVLKKGSNSRDDKSKEVASDSILDDVIAEFAPDDNDRLRRRRAQPGSFLPPSIASVKCETPGFVRTDSVVRPDSTNFSRNETLMGGLDDSRCQRDVPKESKDEKMVSCDVGIDQFSQNGSSSADKCMVVAEAPKMSEVVEPVKRGEVFSLNAKIKNEIDPNLSATADWRNIWSGNNENGGSVEGETNSKSVSSSAGSIKGEANSNGDSLSEEKPAFDLNSDGSLSFFIIDAHEESYGANAGNVYVFGKVKTKATYQSCCAIVKNMQRCVYVIPNGSVFPNDTILELETDLAESRISPTVFRAKLHEMASPLKHEISTKLLDLNVSNFSIAPVKRGYAFERSDVPTGENYVLKITYPFKDPALPTDLKGTHFVALLGTHSSALELFLIKRKIKGPSWLSFSKFASRPAPQHESWCKFELTVDDPKNVMVSPKPPFETPPVIVSSINLKTVINEKKGVNEIVSASVICCREAKIDAPMLASQWKRAGGLSHFTVVRKLEGGIFPLGFTKEVTDRNAKAGCDVLSVASNEKGLLTCLMHKLHGLDNDILVGHNISGFDLDILLHRAQACKVPSSIWSKIGRLKRAVMPKLTKGNTVFGSGASPGIMSCISGRLLCDTYLCARDLLKEVSYSLTQLAKTQLNRDRKEIAPHDIPKAFQTSGSLLDLVEYGETDAGLSMELMFHLSVLPLTRQLTNISGNLWGKTLQGARAQRVEYLLLHAFHEKKFIVPDKLSARDKDALTKRKTIHSADGEDIDDLNNNELNSENEPQQLNHGKRKGPAYAGGLVLEPKKGLYDKYILLLDFNSLYPSIIQEYNICFTTVEKSTDESAPRLPSSRTTGVLPKLLKDLVENRRNVKRCMNHASGPRLHQLDIQQQALKLTANSMYGCLGFSNSRFYAKPLAELITLQGREILQSTVDLVQNVMKLEVIYGDTDSIMIYSGLDDFTQAKKIAAKVIQEVNKSYRCLEIDLDGLYKRMLLLKKKKYAAVKVQKLKDGTEHEVIERKGLDMVRRDWSLLSKELGDFCLRQILSGGSCEDVVESIHSSLVKVQTEMRNGEVALEKYVITKTLTKPPESYPDAKSQPHVQVALRLKQAGYSAGCSAGDTVPYIICCEQGTSSGSSTGIANRARHPDELKKDNGAWIIDIEYYLAHQIHPVVSRLCASIQGTSPARLADCLGLESSKFQSKTNEAAISDSSPLLLFTMDDNERYKGCEPLRLSCPSCSSTFDCTSISSSVLTSSSNKNRVESEAEKESTSNFWCRLRCPRCPDDGNDNRGRMSSAMIANQVKNQANEFIRMYYKGLMTCDDETCKYTTRGINLRVIGDSERGTICPNYPSCNGTLVRKYTETDLYKQLTYFCNVLDTVRFIEKLDLKTRIPLEKELAKIQPVVALAAATVKRLRDRCSYGWVQMKDLTVFTI